jgi:tetratricopeptide (TPR) repeat protein
LLQGDVVNAMTEFRSGLEHLQDGDKREALLRWSGAGALVSDPQRTAESCREIWLERPTDYCAAFLLAQCLGRLGNVSEADDLILHASRQLRENGLSDPERWLQLMWSVWAQEAGEFVLAVNGYRRLLDGRPDDQIALQNYALLLAAAPDPGLRDGASAIAAAQRACDLSEWKSWRTVSVLAAAYAEVGDFTRAVRLAEVALRLAPQREKSVRANRVEQYRRGERYRIVPASGA